MKERTPKRKPNKKFGSKKADRFSDVAFKAEDDAKPGKRRKFQPEFNAELKTAMKYATSNLKREDGRRGKPQRNFKRDGKQLQDDEDKPVLLPPVVDPKILEKYSRGIGVSADAFTNLVFKKRAENKEKKIEFSTEESARNEILLTEQAG
jgi:hypothetical protein